MPMRPRISTLPAALRAQLDRKLKAAAFGDLVAISAWLQSKGHPIKKSALGVYCQKLRERTESATPVRQAASIGAPVASVLRLLCLQSAARSAGSTSAILKRAEAYAAWVGELPQPNIEEDRPSAAPLASEEDKVTASPNISALHEGLLGMFKAMRDQPERWFTVPELIDAGPVSKATAYRRGGDMAAARVLLRRRQADQVEFRLHPRWAETPLGKVLQQRLAARA